MAFPGDSANDVRGTGPTRSDPTQSDPTGSGPLGNDPLAASSVHRDPGPKSILIVDDNVDTAKPLARMLTHFGHKGFYLTSGEEALAYFRDQPTIPDLLLLDVMMPGVDGMEVLRELRADPKTARLPIVMFSAVSDPEYRSHALNKGATDYWIKASLDFEEFKIRVERLLAEAADC